MAHEDIVDGEIVDETPAQALERSHATALAARGEGKVIRVTVQTSGGDYRAYIPMELAPVDVCELWIGAYNKSNAQPNIDEFEPAYNWSDETRESIGLPKRARARLALPSSTLDEPMRVAERVGLARLARRGHAHEAMIQIRTDIKTTYITHLAIGVRNGPILTALQFDRPMPVLGGRHLKFGILLDGARPSIDTPNPRTLPDHAE